MTRRFKLRRLDIQIVVKSLILLVFGSVHRQIVNREDIVSSNGEFESQI